MLAQVDWHWSALERQLMLRLLRSAMHWHKPIATWGVATGAGIAGVGRAGVLTGRLSRGAAAAGTANSSSRQPARRARVMAGPAG